ncbi:MAG: CPXCG motif-containing cysteine-rich protein [Marinoscillum sp.]
MYEHEFLCPYCNAPNAISLDPTVNQQYIEDCQVCCNPIKVTYEFEAGDLVLFDAVSIEQ